MRRPSRLLLAASVAALLTLSACDFDIAGLIAELGPPYKGSTNPEVQAVDEIQEEKDPIKKAAKARDDYLKSGDLTKLGEAARLRPDDPEYYAYALVHDVLNGRDSAIEQGRKLLMEKLAKDRKRRNEPDDEKQLARDYHRLMLEAQARMLAKAPIGTFTKPDQTTYLADIYDSYCQMLSNHNRDYPNDGWLVPHQLDHGFPCK